MSDTEAARKSVGLEGDETLPQKWVRESLAERARLSALSREEIEAELEEHGLPHELLCEVMNRI